jgi:hypothetical protein
MRFLITTDEEGRPAYALFTGTGETLAAKPGETDEEFLRRVRTWTALHLQQRRKARKTEEEAS